MRTPSNVLAMLLIAAAGLIAQPRILVRGTPAIEFGDIYQGSFPTSRMTILNQGTDTLVIEHVDSPCHCTEASIQSKVIPPKDSTVLNVIFNSKEYIDSVSKYVLIVSNDPARRNFSIATSARVISLIRVEPQPVDFGEVRIGSGSTRTVRITNASSDTLRISRLTIPRPELRSISWPGILPPGADGSLVLSFTPSDEKLFAEQIEVDLASGVQPKAYFWVNGQGRKGKGRK